MGPPQSETDLSDCALEDEIALLGEVIVAATSAAAHLSEQQIDTALGLGQEMLTDAAP
jgi:hypothetical protein